MTLAPTLGWVFGDRRPGESVVGPSLFHPHGVTLFKGWWSAGGLEYASLKHSLAATP